MTPQIINIIVGLVVYATGVTGIAGFAIGKLCGRRH